MRATFSSQILGLAIFIAGAVPAGASTFVAMTAEELIREADAVVQGRVVGLDSRWDEAGRIVVTDIVVQVSETIVGVPRPQVTVRVPGGQVADFRVEAPGFPALRQGEEVILFVSDDQTLQFSRIVGHQQGHFEVVTRLDGVTLAVPRIEAGAGFVTPSGRPLPAQSSALDEFKGRVRAEAARIGKFVP